MAFDLVDEYTGLCLGADVSALPRGATVVVECPRRQTPEPSYSWVHVLWWTVFGDGRSVVSVPPGAGETVERIVRGLTAEQSVFDAAVAERLRQTLGLPASVRVITDLLHACDGETLRHHPLPTCRRLTPADAALREGESVPPQCLAAGAVFGVVVDGTVASSAYAHRTGELQDRVADVGVVTVEAYRRRGFAKACVSALFADFIGRGGAARYSCSTRNAASRATAAAVGCVPYGRSLILSLPPA